MASSDVEICNQALSRIGTTKLISALDERGRVEADQCRLWYDRLRREVLRTTKVSWPFATRRARLETIAGETRTDWSYVYALPPKCLFAREIVLPGARDPWLYQGVPYRTFGGTMVPGATALPSTARQVPFRIEARVDGDGEVVGKLLLCDVQNAELLYTIDVENPVAFDPDFEDALAWRLAVELAASLRKDQASIVRTCQTSYLEALVRASAAASAEGQSDPDPVSAFEASRH